MEWDQLARTVRRAGANLLEIARSRHYYRGWLDFAKATWLRVSESRPLRRFLSRPGKVTAIHLRVHPDPVCLRSHNSDFHVLRGIFEIGEYDRVLEMGLRQEPNIFDLGANIGLLAVFLNVHFPRCRVVSVEPDMENCRMFRQNCARMLATGRLRLIEGFVAAKDGEASILREGRSWAYRKTDLNGTERITCYSLPTLIQLGDFGTIDLLKCDIEGSEEEIFADCSGWIQNVRHLVVETHGRYGPSQLEKALRAGGGSFRIVAVKASADTSVVFLSAVSALEPVAA